MSTQRVAATDSATNRKKSGPALTAHGLSKRFGKRVAFQDVSFEIGYGEVFGFLGPNGAGKTTTVRTLGTLIAPTSGEATVAGLPLTRENGVAIRQRIAIMPEAPGLYLRLTVAENLACFAGLYGLRDPRQRIEQALRAVNLMGRANDQCGKLSKGLRQRVSLARALLNDADVLFLDEPTSGLDPVAAREVHELIAGLRQRGVTIFLTTHRLDEAERLCDRVALLNTTLRAIGRPDELREQLFAKTLTVRTQAPLPEPEPRLWRPPRCQQLARRTARMAGRLRHVPPHRIRRGQSPRQPSPGRSWQPEPMCSRSPSHTIRSKTSISN